MVLNLFCEPVWRGRPRRIGSPYFSEAFEKPIHRSMGIPSTSLRAGSAHESRAIPRLREGKLRSCPHKREYAFRLERHNPGWHGQASFVRGASDAPAQSNQHRQTSWQRPTLLRLGRHKLCKRVAASSAAWRWRCSDMGKPSPRPSALTLPPIQRAILPRLELGPDSSWELFHLSIQRSIVRAIAHELHAP